MKKKERGKAKGKIGKMSTVIVVQVAERFVNKRVAG